jgi:hypothetical protein
MFGFTKSMITEWHRLTFREAMTQSPIKVDWGVGEKRQLIEQLDFLHRDSIDSFLDKKISGGMSEGWKDLNNLGIFYQECLCKTIEETNGRWTPADYILICYKQAVSKNIPIKEMDFGRALRGLPSFLREYLICEKLNQYHSIKSDVPHYTANADCHVDFFIRYDKKRIAVWSFISTKKSLDYLIELKITGLRGTVLDGLNLLAPFDPHRDNESHLKWYLPSDLYVGRLLLAALTNEPIPYANLLKKTEPETFKDFVLFHK